MLATASAKNPARRSALTCAAILALAWAWVVAGFDAGTTLIQPVILGWTRQMNRYVPTGAVTLTVVGGTGPASGAPRILRQVIATEDHILGRHGDRLTAGG